MQISGAASHTNAVIGSMTVRASVILLAGKILQ
jgi:hypothetical protein